MQVGSVEDSQRHACPRDPPGLRRLQDSVFWWGMQAYMIAAEKDRMQSRRVGVTKLEINAEIVAQIGVDMRAAQG
ncbi:MAG: hypothetical protein AMXMBFR7_35130 [Planctomycetota bacterium]